MRSRYLLVLLPVLLAHPLHAQTTYTWVGGTGDWHTAGNWSPAGIPAAQDTAVVSSGTVNVDSDASVAGLHLTGGTLSGSATLTVTAQARWTGGMMRGTGTTLIPVGSVLSIEGSSSKTLADARVIENQGTVLWSGSGSISLPSGSTAVIENAGTFEAHSDATFGTDNPFRATFLNEGLFRKVAGEGETLLNASLRFVNDGTLEVASGIVRMRSGHWNSADTTAHTGAFVAAAGATLRFANGRNALLGGVSLSGDGAMRLTGGTLLVEGAVPAERLEQSGGTLTGEGTLTIADEFVWSGGTMRGTGTTLIPVGSVLSIEGSSSKTLADARVIENQGTVLWSGSGSISLGSGSTAVIENAGTFEAHSDATFGTDNPFRATFLNEGLFRKVAGEGETTIHRSLHFENAGTLEVASGTVRIRSGHWNSGETMEHDGAFVVAEQAALRFSDGGHELVSGSEVRGTGTFWHSGGTLTNHATFSPGLSPGLLTFDGDFAMASGDAGVAIELGGTVPGDEYDRLDVAGSASLQGTLQLEVIDGLVPAPTDTLAVLTAESVEGTFDEVELPAGFDAEVVYGEDEVRVVFPASSCDGIPVTTTDDSGPGSLRDAILVANALGEEDTICFAIPGDGPHTIAPQSSLPALTNSVVIDGFSQPGSSPNTLAVGTDAVLMIELDGDSAGAGLSLNGGGSVVRGLVINRFGGAGVRLAGSGGHLVEGSFIGTDVTGMEAMGNGVGIDVTSADNTIGGAAPAARNVIAGNGEDGINHWFAPASGSTIQGNYIGTNAAGTAALPNGRDGVRFDGAGDALVGGPAEVPGTPPGNLISGNDRFGVFMVNAGSEDSVIQGNIVCADATGTAAIPNGSNAIYVVRSGRNIIGGTAPGAGNLVSGCTSNAIGVERSDESVVQGNLVGPDITGMTLLGNTSRGVNLTRSADVLVGGTDPAARNVISGNQIGVRFNDRARDNLVHGNYIGVAVDGQAPIPNELAGVLIRHDSRENVIGGTEPGEGNVIAHSGTAGVAVIDDATANSILGNTIYASGTIGIDLGGDGPTPNDPGDGDSGPNQLRNFPEILVADIDAGGDLFVEYVIDTDPENATYPLRVEFFVADEAETAGEVFLGFDVYTESDHGGAPANPQVKTVTLGSAADLGVEIGTRLVATATDADGNTSEFSAAAFGVPIADGPSLPEAFELEAVYPNPLRASATVAFTLPEAAEVALTLYDLLGRRVAVLLDGEYAAGRHNAAIDANGLASGVYVVRLAAGGEVAVRRVTVVR